MIHTFIAELKQKAESSSMDTLRYYFSDEIVKRLDRSPAPVHRLKRITSRLMLVQIFKLLELGTSRLKGLTYNRHGKLVMESGKPNISISYSNNIVVCGVSEDKVGIDVEDTSESPAARNMELLERWTGKKVGDKMDFYALWTQIESIAKLYDDKGLADVFYGNLLSEQHYTRQYLHNNNYLVSMSSATELDATDPIKTLTI